MAILRPKMYKKKVNHIFNNKNYIIQRQIKMCTLKCYIITIYLNLHYSQIDLYFNTEILKFISKKLKLNKINI